MQLLMNASRLLILLALSCGLLIIWEYNSLVQSNYNNTEIATQIAGINIFDTDDDVGIEAVESSVKKTSAATSPAIEKVEKKPIVTLKPEQIPVKPGMSVWGSIGPELKLDHKVQSLQVKKEIRRLLSDPSEFHRILNAAAPYIHYIYTQTKTRGLPAELALIPYIESEFNPNDRSNKGAMGLWQLMPGTARELGVKIKAGYDGRRNVIASTKAALLYFRDLGKNFKGNWYLAIAAYNCGQVRVESAIRRAGIKDVWNLSVPRDTKFYVPRLLALAEIIKHPEKYGVKLPTVVNTPYFTQLTLQKASTLDQVAKSAGINVKLLQKLNPDFKQGKIPITNPLLVPVANKSTLVTAKLFTAKMA